MLKVIYIILNLFCFDHLMRDHLQDKGIKNWYTTYGHSWFSFIPDTPSDNNIGMATFLYLAFKS